MADTASPAIIIEEQSARLINHTNLVINRYAEEYRLSIAQVISDAARVSTSKLVPLEKHQAEDFVRKLMAKGHWSPFEFFDLTFQCHTSRAVSHELVRHRLASYMQKSQRYVRYDEYGLKVIIPPAIASDVHNQYCFLKSVNAAYDAYKTMIAFNGAKPETARAVLPEATATTILVKMNLREFRHFLALRTAPAAWSQMRELAGMMAESFRKKFPDEMYLIDDVQPKEASND